MRKKILLFGGTGGLGIKLAEELKDGFDCTIIGSSICDVTNEDKVKNFIEANKFDIIIYLSVKNIDGLLHKQSNDNVKEQLDVNIFGLLNVLRYATPKFKEQSFGRIIYISSILSERPIRGTGIYSASKAFCDNIIKTYSLENSRYGITANSIQLGYFEGGLTEKVPPEILENVIKSIPLKRLGTSREFANVVKTLIHTEYINGTKLSITGGY